MAQRRSGANSSTSLRNGTLSTTDGCDRGVRPRILRHCTEIIRTASLDASVTMAMLSDACTALQYCTASPEKLYLRAEQGSQAADCRGGGLRPHTVSDQG